MIGILRTHKKDSSAGDLILDDFWDIATYISFGTYQQSSNISLFTTRNHYICPLEDPRSGKMLGHRDWLMFRSASGSKKK